MSILGRRSFLGSLVALLAGLWAPRGSKGERRLEPVLVYEIPEGKVREYWCDQGGTDHADCGCHGPVVPPGQYQCHPSVTSFGRRALLVRPNKVLRVPGPPVGVLVKDVEPYLVEYVRKV